MNRPAVPFQHFSVSNFDFLPFPAAKQEDADDSGGGLGNDDRPIDAALVRAQRDAKVDSMAISSIMGTDKSKMARPRLPWV